MQEEVGEKCAEIDRLLARIAESEDITESLRQHAENNN